MRVAFALIVSSVILASSSGCGCLRGLLFGNGAACGTACPAPTFAGPPCECGPGAISSGMPWGGYDGGVVSDGYTGGFGMGDGWVPSVPSEPGYVPGTMNISPSQPTPAP